MSRPHRGALGGAHAPMLVGWLFADILLVLFLVAIASVPPPAVADKANPTRSVTPPATTPAKPTPRVLEQAPHTINVDVPPSRIRNSASRAAAETQLLDELEQQLVAQGLQSRQAGFVLVFAYGPVDGIGQAVDTANVVLGILEAKGDQFRQASGLGYWTGTGNLEFKIFFYV